MSENKCVIEFKEEPFDGHEKLIVDSFTGTESVSQLYRFEIIVAAKIAEINVENHWFEVSKALRCSAKLSVFPQDTTKLSSLACWNGVITRVEQHNIDESNFYYKFVLEPEQSKLALMNHSDVYIDQNVEQVIDAVMTQAGFVGKRANLEDVDKDSHLQYIFDDHAEQDFSTVITNSYQHFTCQFQESCLDFLNRRAEFYGLHYTISQCDERPVMVFSHGLKIPPEKNDKFKKVYYQHGASSGGKFRHKLKDKLTNKLKDKDRVEVTKLNRGLQVSVDDLVLQRHPTFFNTSDANLSPAHPEDFGKESITTGAPPLEHYSIADQFEMLDKPIDGNNDTENNCDTVNESIENRRVSGKFLAQVRSLSALAKAQQVSGEATSPGILSGDFIHVDENSRSDDWDRRNDYFVLSVNHSWGDPNKQNIADDKATTAVYKADFVLHPCFKDNGVDENAFYPIQKTLIPRIESVVGGFIDGLPYKGKNESAPDKIDVTYPKIDKFGRYKVRLSFAKSLQASYEKNSSWMRLATPYAGGDSGKVFNNSGQVVDDQRYAYAGGMHFPLRVGTEVLVSFVNGDPDYPVIVSALNNQKSPSPVTNANPEKVNGGSNRFVIQTPVGNNLTATDVANTPKQSSWCVYSPSSNTQIQLGGFLYTDENDKIKGSSGYMLATEGNGVIQSDENLYLISKKSVITIQGTEAKNKFGALVDKTLDMNLKDVPSNAVMSLAKDEDDKKEKAKEWKWDLKSDDIIWSNDCTPKISGKSVDLKVTGTGVSGSATATGGAASVAAAGVSGSLAFKGLDATIAVTGYKLLASVSGGAFTFSATGMDHKVDVCLRRFSYSLVKKESKVDFTKKDEVQLADQHTLGVENQKDYLKQNNIIKGSKKLYLSNNDKTVTAELAYITLETDAKTSQTQKATLFTGDYGTATMKYTVGYKIKNLSDSSHIDFTNTHIETKVCTSTIKSTTDAIKIDAPTVEIKGKTALKMQGLTAKIQASGVLTLN